MCLEHDTALTACWFESNYMKFNTEKCHLIISGNKHESLWADIRNDKIWESSNVKFLGVNIDRGLKFNPLSANPEKWSNTLKQIVGKLPTICLSVFDHFSGLALKGLMGKC